MSELIVNSLWNVNVYLNGVGLLGRAAEASVPQPKRKMQDYKGLGMAGGIEIPVGWEKLEGRIKWSSFDLDTLIGLNMSTGQQQISMLGDLQTISAGGLLSESPVIMNWTAICKDPGPLEFKAQENVEYTSMFAVYHVDLSIAGQQVFVWDSLANILIVNGLDQLSVYRANIGG
jgi:uncharacterized protein